MAGYKARLAKDLDGWISAGLVPAASRAPILDSVVEERRLDTASVLAAIGALLLGAAAIAFVAANWGAIPRLPRFGLILGLFLAVSGAAAWAAKTRRRPLATNILLAVAACIYAAAIGLTGQIFDIVGDPQRALRGAGLAAGVLTLAGRSSAAGVVALALLGLGEFAGDFDRESSRWLVFAAPVGMALSWIWNSKPLAHASALALIVGLVSAISVYADWGGGALLAGAAVLAGLAALARQLGPRRTASIFLLWFVWGALLLFGFAGLSTFKGGALIAHRLGWLLVGGGVITLGLHDRQGMITAAGVVAMIAAVCTILFDLGLGLMTAAGLFAACAVIALVAGFLMRRRAKA
jgi:uncharacterized membrane protein